MSLLPRCSIEISEKTGSFCLLWTSFFPIPNKFKNYISDKLIDIFGDRAIDLSLKQEMETQASQEIRKLYSYGYLYTGINNVWYFTSPPPPWAQKKDNPHYVGVCYNESVKEEKYVYKRKSLLNWKENK